MTASIAQRVQEVLALSPDSGAVEFAGAWTSWRALDQAARQVETHLHALGAPADAPIGWVARNSPAGVAGFVGLLRSGRPIAPLRPNLSVRVLCEDIQNQRLCAIVGNGPDWSVSEAVVDAAKAVGSAGVSIIDNDAHDFSVGLVPGLETIGPPPHRAEAPGMVVERLSSGTTGPPKRIPVYVDKVLPSLEGAEASQSTSAGEALRLKSSPSIMLTPFTHAGGIFGLLMAFYQARPIILFDRFDVERWVAAIERYRPKSASLVPAMIRMVLNSDAKRESLASLKAMRSSTAALDPSTQLEFEERFGVPILIDYGAAEFLGGVAGWSLADHREFAKTKLGSVGRPRPDIVLRIINPDSKQEAPAGAVGQLELKSERFSPDWIRTNDLARVDEDGFVFIHGRLDDAINRGGFKILPDEVAPIMRRFAGVRDATMVGYPDARLGQVPVAIIEAARDIDLEGLRAFLRENLLPYQVPTDFKVIDAFPRTTTMKIDRPALRAMLGLA